MKFRSLTKKDCEEVFKPYSGPSDPDLPQNVQDLPADERAKWVAIFNNVYNTCVADGGSNDDCEARAFSTAWGVINGSEETN